MVGPPGLPGRGRPGRPGQPGLQGATGLIQAFQSPARESALMQHVCLVPLFLELNTCPMAMYRNLVKLPSYNGMFARA